MEKKILPRDTHRGLHWHHSRSVQARLEGLRSIEGRARKQISNRTLTAHTSAQSNELNPNRCCYTGCMVGIVAQEQLNYVPLDTPE